MGMDQQEELERIYGSVGRGVLYELGVPELDEIELGADMKPEEQEHKVEDDNEAEQIQSDEEDDFTEEDEDLTVDEDDATTGTSDK